MHVTWGYMTTQVRLPWFYETVYQQQLREDTSKDTRLRWLTQSQSVLHAEGFSGWGCAVQYHHPHAARCIFIVCLWQPWRLQGSRKTCGELPTLSQHQNSGKRYRPSCPWLLRPVVQLLRIQQSCQVDQGQQHDRMWLLLRKHSNQICRACFKWIRDQYDCSVLSRDT